MALNTNLTDNELKAALVLVNSCLDGMGGSRPADLGGDEYTWVSAKDLMAAGWNKNEATGTFGALMDKGFVSEYDKNEWVLETEAWKYLDTIWDAQTATPTEKVMTKPVANVLAIEPETTTFHFITEAATDHVHQGVILVRVAEDLEALSGPQAVAFFNAAKSEHTAPVKRFADKKAAASRLWAVFQDLAIKAQFAADEAAATGQPAPAPVKRDHKVTASANLTELAGVLPAADKARDRAKPAKATDTPAPKARKSAGINLAPLKKVYACRAGTKQAKLIDLLSRPQGATFKELHAAMTSPEFSHLKPWAEVTTRSALGWDVHHVKGYGVRTTKRENGEDCYRLTYPAGMNEPLAHQPRKTAAEKPDLAEVIKAWATENYHKSYGASALIETKTDEELRTEFKSLADAKSWAKLISEQYQNAQG